MSDVVSLSQAVAAARGYVAGQVRERRLRARYTELYWQTARLEYQRSLLNIGRDLDLLNRLIDGPDDR